MPPTLAVLTPEDWTAVILSLKVAVVATVAALPLAVAAALALARGRFWGRSLLDALIHLPLVAPPVATGLMLLALFGRNGVLGPALERMGITLAFDWKGAALASAVMAFPLIVRPIRQAIEAIDPQVYEAAQTLGAGPWARFSRLTLPLAGPGIASGAVLGFARALGEFGATITFAAAIPGLTLTLPSAIWAATQTPGDEARAWTLCLIAGAVAAGAVLAADRLARRRP